MNEQKRSLKINVPILARVEGEGALRLHIVDNEITDLNFSIYEPPRYYEKFLVGRNASEVMDVVARICGICPVAYQMSAVTAIESAYEFTVSNELRDLRRAMYCGEWIQSHALHVFLLAAPDYFGVNSVVELSKLHAEQVKRGLFIQNIGNQLIRLFGGRSVHPVGVRIGGFHKLPSAEDVSKLIKTLDEGLAEAETMLAWVSSFSYPNNPQNFTSVALGGDRYPLFAGDFLQSSAGHCFALDEFEQYIQEFQVPHSTAFHALLEGKPYLVGPLARMNLHAEKLPDELLVMMKANGIEFPSSNMFHSAVARAVEITLALMEARKILGQYQTIQQGEAPEPREAIGFGCTEAPRGTLWHRYELDDQGVVKQANIVPPTSQNQARIEEDLRASLTTFGLHQDEAALRLHGEKVIRNYDPCISCSTHFLKLELRRE